MPLAESENSADTAFSSSASASSNLLWLNSSLPLVSAVMPILADPALIGQMTTAAANYGIADGAAQLAAMVRTAAGVE